MLGLDLDEHVGRKWIRLDAKGISPLIEAVIAADADENEVLAKVNTEVRSVLERNFIAYQIAFGNEPLDFQYESKAKIIEPREAREQEWETARQELGRMLRDSDDRRIEELKAHPDNGKVGYWQVDGVRHDAIVHASSAIEAVKKAEASGAVGDWESATAYFIGETMPEVH